MKNTKAPKFFASFFFFLAIFFSTRPLRPSELPCLGVIEFGVEGKYSGQAPYDRLRPLFVSDHGIWRVLPWTADSKDGQIKARTKAPLNAEWYAFVPGKSAVRFQSKWIKSEWYAERGYYTVPGVDEHLPIRSKDGADNYVGFEPQEPSYRPIPVTNYPRQEKVAWTLTDASKIRIQDALVAFKGVHVGRTYLRQVENGIQKKKRFEDLTSKDIRVEWVFQSSDGVSLVSVGPAAGVFKYDDENMSQTAFGSKRFIVSVKKWEPVTTDGMPVEAGDFDGDGNIEWLFSVSDYNLGGYKIYDASFRELASYLWGFH